MSRVGIRYGRALGMATAVLVALLLGSAAVGEPVPAQETRTAEQLRSSLEQAMARLGELANDAKRETDVVRANCVLAKHKRAAKAMEVATGELLVIRDTSAGEEARTFALEKLRAAVERVESLVDEATACTGERGPEATDDEVSTDSLSPQTIPMADPTKGLGDPPIPPPADGGWVAVASPTE